jgi:hypothetical protein
MTGVEWLTLQCLRGGDGRGDATAALAVGWCGLSEGDGERQRLRGPEVRDLCDAGSTVRDAMVVMGGVFVLWLVNRMKSKGEKQSNGANPTTPLSHVAQTLNSLWRMAQSLSHSGLCSK